MTIQTAFRLEESLIEQMKRRSKSRKQSMNAYVKELIENDLRNALILPKITLPETLDEDIACFAGRMRKPTPAELNNDERLRRTWER